MDIWIYGYIDIWIYGYMDDGYWIYPYMNIYSIYPYMAIWIYVPHIHIWLYGYIFHISMYDYMDICIYIYILHKRLPLHRAIPPYDLCATIAKLNPPASTHL